MQMARNKAVAMATVVLVAGCGGGGGADGVTGAQVAELMSGGSHISAAPVAATDAAVATPNWALGSGTVLATFDIAGVDDTSVWKYSDNAVPEAYKGNVQQTTGSNGNGARFNFDFDCGQARITSRQNNCGFAAEMRKTFTVPVAVSGNPSISFDLRAPTASAQAALRVHDSTGQVLSFPINSRTIEAVDGQRWAKVHLPIGRSASYYGGANDGVLHGPIRAIAVVAASTAVGYPRGHFAVDNVQLRTDATYTFNLRSDAALASGAFYPTYENRLGVNIHNYSPEILDKLNAVGLKLVRRGFSWSYVERAGAYEFGGYDIWARALKERGMSILALLAYGHPEHGGAAPRTDADRQAFARFASATTSYLKSKGVSVAGYEVWNEPDVVAYWPNPDAVSYSKLLSVTADSIRSADSGAKVISGGIGVLGIKALSYYYQLAQTGVLSKVDGLGIHPYRHRAPETFAEDQLAIHKVREQFGFTAPLWATEWGYSSYEYVDNAVYGDGLDPRAQRRQAVLTLRQVLTQLALNTKVMIVYNATDGTPHPTDREQNFGLFRQDLSEKPSYQALKTLWNVAQKSRTFKGFVSDVPAGLHVLRWDGASDQVFALWHDGLGIKGTVSLPAGVIAVTKWDGTMLDARNALTLTEEDGPVFVTVRR